MVLIENGEKSMREKLQTLPLAQLKELAKSQGIKGCSTMRKGDLIDALCAVAEQEELMRTVAMPSRPAAPESDHRTEQEANPRPRMDRRTDGDRRGESDAGGRTYMDRRTENERRPETGGRPNRQQEVLTPQDVAELDSGIAANGILEVMPDGFGFIRCENFLPGENDVYVAPSQIRRFNLKTGDIITGSRRVKAATEKFAALLYIKNVNGYPVSVVERRPHFENLTPNFHNQRLHQETQG